MTRTVLKWILPALALLTTPLLAQTDDPNRIGSFKPFYVEYTVGNNLINAGIATLSLQAGDGEWVYSLKTEPAGIFRLTGKGRINEVSVLSVTQDKELIPHSYSFSQAGDEKRRNVEADFNWEAQELTIRHRGEEATEELTDPILDRLSVTLTVMDLVREGFERADLQILDGGKIKAMSFINEGRQTVDTALGSFDTIVVRRIREGSSRETVTWFAPELDYVPVMIEQLKRGELVARLKIRKLREGG
ncbi:DUF3108 domain-containing protein [Granulosicoccaceae sp. 1_MG-2023]|nr:DUF3108 domain-containing protein [Granulosicoccaceae sp. 1_MG-2023]